jgi:hypothetical protein
VIGRNAEGGALLSDVEQAALVRMVAAWAIYGIDEDGWESLPELAEGAWNALADDLTLFADELVMEATGRARRAGFDIDELIVALS